MPLTADPALVDTNVLVEATDEARAHHADSLTLLESGRPLSIPAQVIREYLAVATRPVAANGPGKRVHDAQIVAMALPHRIRTIVSLNPDDFVPLSSEVATLTPSQALHDRPHAARPPRVSRGRRIP